MLGSYGGTQMSFTYLVSIGGCWKAQHPTGRQRPAENLVSKNSEYVLNNMCWASENKLKKYLFKYE